MKLYIGRLSNTNEMIFIQVDNNTMPNCAYITLANTPRIAFTSHKNALKKCTYAIKSFSVVLVARIVPESLQFLDAQKVPSCIILLCSPSIQVPQSSFLNELAWPGH